MASEPRTVRRVIAENARRLRGRRSQDEIAANCRTVGLGWSRQVITSIEAEERHLELDELILFAWALADEDEDGLVVGGAVSDLLAGKGRVRVGERTAPLPLLRRLLSSPADLGAPGRLSRSPRRSTADVQLAERRAAEKLGVEPSAIARAAYVLWGRSLSEERDAVVAQRVGADVDLRVRRALRGRVTRELVEQIKVKIELGG